MRGSLFRLRMDDEDRRLNTCVNVFARPDIQPACARCARLANSFKDLLSTAMTTPIKINVRLVLSAWAPASERVRAERHYAVQ